MQSHHFMEDLKIEKRPFEILQIRLQNLNIESDDPRLNFELELVLVEGDEGVHSAL